MAIFNLDADPVQKLGRFTKVDINLACTRMQELQFLISADEVGIIKGCLIADDAGVGLAGDNLKDNSKDNLKNNLDQISKDKLLKVSGKFYFNDNKNYMVNLKIVGSLDLICQRCGGKLLWPVSIEDDYFLMDSYSAHKDSLEHGQGMEVLCDRGRLDLVSLAAQEIGLVVDMIPKHTQCPGS